MATESPGVYPSNNIVNYAAVPPLVPLTIEAYSSCFSVPSASKIPCMSNADALVQGSAGCVALGCCFIRNIKDLDTPMCFSTIEKGN